MREDMKAQIADAFSRILEKEDIKMVPDRRHDG